MDGNTYERSSRIHADIVHLSARLNEKRDFDTASRLLPFWEDLTHLIAEITLRKNRQEMI